MRRINKILVVGDSLTKGVILDEERKRYVLLPGCFVKLVSEKLKPEVINASKFGARVDYGLKALEKQLKSHNPELVMIEFGGNDCDFLWDEIAGDPEQVHNPGTGLVEFASALAQMEAMIKEAGALPVFMTAPPLNATGYFNWFTQGDRGKGERILRWLGYPWRIYWWQERYVSAVRDVCAKTGALLVDIRAAFLRQFDFADDFCGYVCSDGIHPNERGHAFIASELLKIIGEKAPCLLA